MGNTIEIKETFGEYSIFTKKIADNFLDVEKHLSKADEYLAKTDRWSGDAHDQCVMAHELLGNYTTATKSLIEDLEACLKELEKCRSEFESGSSNVKEWESL